MEIPQSKGDLAPVLPRWSADAYGQQEALARLQVQGYRRDPLAKITAVRVGQWRENYDRDGLALLPHGNSPRS